MEKTENLPATWDPKSIRVQQSIHTISHPEKEGISRSLLPKRKDRQGLQGGRDSLDKLLPLATEG